MFGDQTLAIHWITTLMFTNTFKYICILDMPGIGLGFIVVFFIMPL